MSMSEHELLVGICERAAQLWSEGDDVSASAWFEMAKEVLDGRDFVDSGTA